ncbi:MAG: hypothetical protein DHS20C15_00920 [Planctomycetota bacterium]|nr:MAG: hypothetical protein DHS20C15_00920 [Planctomycetota bacterium]
MKNPALPAVVLLVLGGVVFGIAYWLDGSGSDGPVEPLNVPESVDTIVPSTPMEIRRAEKLEKAKEDLAHYREIGELTEHGVIKVPDVDGKHYFVKNKIVEGVGRYGEPIYAIAKYKPRPLVPLVPRKGVTYENAHRATPKQQERIMGNAFAPRPTAEGAASLAGSLPEGAMEGHKTANGKDGPSKASSSTGNGG